MRQKGNPGTERSETKPRVRASDEAEAWTQAHLALGPKLFVPQSCQSNWVVGPLSGCLRLGAWHPQLRLPEGRLCPLPVRERTGVPGPTGWSQATPELFLGRPSCPGLASSRGKSSPRHREAAPTLLITANSSLGWARLCHHLATSSQTQRRAGWETNDPNLFKELSQRDWGRARGWGVPGVG